MTEWLVLPNRSLGLVMDVQASGGVSAVDEIVQGCSRLVMLEHEPGCGLNVRLLSETDGVAASDLFVCARVETERPPAPYLAASGGGAPFAGAGGFGQRMLQQLHTAVKAQLPIVLVGHGLLEFDLALLFAAFHRQHCDIYAAWCDAGVVGVVDTLRLAKACTWSSPPADATGKESYHVENIHESLGLGEGVMDEQRDSEREVSDVIDILPRVLACPTDSLSMLSIHQAVCRLRVLRDSRSRDSMQQREISDVREIVRHFERRAAHSTSYSFPTPISKAARQAVQSEAARVGIRVELVGEGEQSTVRVVNLPRADAVCVADAAAEAYTVGQVTAETEA